MYNLFIIIIALLIPIFSGLYLLVKNPETRKNRQLLVFFSLLVSSILIIAAALSSTGETLTLIKITEHLTFAFKLDGLGKVFVIMVSILWLITSVYAFEYMKHESKENRFFAFFLMSFTMVMGLGFAANMLTLYTFYEFITLITLPLVMHQLNGKARHAGKIYIEYMMFGASFAFVGLIFVLNFEAQPDFMLGGILDTNLVSGSENLLLGVFLIAALGFGVKSAIFPFHKWLPTASVAPTPVTALLHAVAVVNAGIFSMIRLIYYTFGVDLLNGSWAQTVLIILASITIVYGSTMALRSTHIKRRFAYSTIANLSYIILAISFMNEAGLTAGVMHMIFHSVLKMTLFFVAGNILYSTGKEYLDQIGGFAHSMKTTFASLVVAGIGLCGIPPLIGFYSKYLIGNAALNSENAFSIIGLIALLISALLTCIYVMEIIIKGYISKEKPVVKEVNNYMKIPLKILVSIIIIMSLFVNEFTNIVSNVIGG